MTIEEIGALLFGLVIGWITYRTLRRKEGTGISDLASVIAAVGGATITALFRPGTKVFGFYCIGLAVGFFLYLIINYAMNPKDTVGWMAVREDK